MGVLSTREDILIYSLAYRCCGNGRNTGQTRLHLQCGGNREFGFPCVCLFVCLAVCRSHMVKKHCRYEKGMGPELYPDKYALLSCNSKTVTHEVILTAHSLRNTSTYTCPLFPPHIHLWSWGSPSYSPIVPRSWTSCFIDIKPLCTRHFLVGLRLRVWGSPACVNKRISSAIRSTHPS